MPSRLLHAVQHRQGGGYLNSWASHHSCLPGLRKYYVLEDTQEDTLDNPFKNILENYSFWDLRETFAQVEGEAASYALEGSVAVAGLALRSSWHLF